MDRIDQYLLRFCQFLTVLMPFWLLLGPAGGDITASAVAIFFLVHSLLKRDFSWLKEDWVQLALLLWLVITLRSFFAAEPEVALSRAGVWLRFPVFAAALVHWVLRDERVRKYLLLCLIATVVFTVADTLWQYFFTTDVMGHARRDYDGIVRLTGPLAKPRVGITIAWLLFPALFYAAEIRKPVARLLATVALGAAAAIAVYLSGERMALVLVVLGLGLGFLMLPRLRMALLAIVLIAASGNFYLTQHNQLLVNRQVNTAQHIAKTGFWQSAYGQTWLSSLGITRTHPLFGVGVRQFQRECVKPEYGPTSADALILRCPMHPHNMYLEWLAESGVLVLGLFVAMASCWVVPLLRNWRSWRGDALMTGLFVTLLLRLLPFAVTPSQFVAWVSVPLWLVVGWLLVLVRERPSA